MKKIYLTLLILSLVLSFIPESTEAADSMSKTVSIPTETLIGSSNSQKTYYLDIPSGVSSSSILTSSLKYNGTNQKMNLSIENGKIKLTLKGMEKKERIDNLTGYNASFTTKFYTNPGNSIWRYSDGRRWQINEWDPNNNTQKHNDRNGTGWEFPSMDPPKITVVTKSDASRSGIKWYNGSVNAVIDPSAIIESTVRIIVDTDIKNLPPTYVNHNIVNKNSFVIYYSLDKDLVDYDSEEVSESFGKGGNALGRRYKTFLYYSYTASANVTTYKYSGNVSFDYTLPTEPTLTGTVTLNKPNPNPTKLGDKDEPVQISLMGQLQGYNDASNIDEWVFYAKEKDRNNTLKTKKESAKTFNVSTLFDFEIKKSSVTGEYFTQEYALTVLVRFKKPIVTKSGTITSLEQPLQISAGVYKNNPQVTFPPNPTIPTEPEGKPPIARISTARYIKAGSDMLVSGNASYDPDGYITDYAWSTSGAQGEIGNVPRGYVWYTIEQVGETFPIALTVVDNDGQIGSTSTEVTVIEPKPAAILNIEGILKQNRKTTLFNRSQSPTRFPLIPSKTRVTITAVSGGTNADIKYSGTLSELESKDILFKKAGKYKATIYVENTLGYSDNDEITFDIVPDEAPYNYFTLPGVVYRSPDYGNKAVVSLDDISYSPDKDVVGRRLWEYRYDSNNDGSFSGEAWVTFSNENKDRLNLELSEVGKYEVRLTVFEEFGQPTIDEFVTEADRKSTNSDGQKLSSRIVEVKNRAPEVDWSW
ncbi:PKD domain-containing protein [Paenibacillus sp. FSL R5-0470]|uniref:PKD domain-containing protein n=1 Tax=Paenibacillus sp. FSL R5-0470 TaxID=2921641 RepID=UPI0030DC8C3A